MADHTPAGRDPRRRPFGTEGLLLHGMRRSEDPLETPDSVQTELADAHKTRPDTLVKTTRPGTYTELSAPGTDEALVDQRTTSPSQTQGSALPKSPLGEWSEHDVAELAEWLDLGEETVGMVINKRVNGNLILDVLTLAETERDHILETNFAVPEPWSRVQLIRTVQELAAHQGGHSGMP